MVLSNMKFKLFGVLLFLVITFILVFASLFGENNHADDLVDSYFTNLKEGEFPEKCIPISIASNRLSDKTCSDDNFIFIVSVLKHFNLVGSKSYGLELQRSHFWVPYISSDTLSVGIYLTAENEDTNIIFNLFDKPQYLSDLFIIKRNFLKWNIHEINITDSELINTFFHFKNTLDLDKYITQTTEGYLLNSTKIDNSTITEVDKFLLKYNIQKIKEFLK